MNELDIEDEEYLHDLIDEIIHVEGRWDTNERKIMWKDTQSPMTHVQVREYFCTMSVWSDELSAPLCRSGRQGK